MKDVTTEIIPFASLSCDKKLHHRLPCDKKLHHELPLWLPFPFGVILLWNARMVTPA